MQFDEALTAIVEGFQYDGKKYPPIGLDTYKFLGKSFETIMDNLRTEVSKYANPETVENEIREDTLLKVASQVCLERHFMPMGIPAILLVLYCCCLNRLFATGWIYPV